MTFGTTLVYAVYSTSLTFVAVLVSPWYSPPESSISFLYWNVWHTRSFDVRGFAGRHTTRRCCPLLQYCILYFLQVPFSGCLVGWREWSFSVFRLIPRCLQTCYECLLQNPTSLPGPFPWVSAAHILYQFLIYHCVMQSISPYLYTTNILHWNSTRY
jgi:hypothetical protein